MALHFCEECGNFCGEKHRIGDDEYLCNRCYKKREAQEKDISLILLMLLTIPFILLFFYGMYVAKAVYLLTVQPFYQWFGAWGLVGGTLASVAGLTVAYLWTRKRVKMAEKWYSKLWWRFLRTTLFWTDLALLCAGAVIFHDEVHPLF